ncbi:MAG: N-acetylmuramoyl-L-alanine amidase [Prosthecobacter sp.]
MKFRHFIALTAQTCIAFASLAGSAASLVWLEKHNMALPTPALPRWDHSAPLVIVDAGHGGHDGGAVANDVIEKDLALDLARRVKRELLSAGLRVMTTRDTDVFLPLEDRAAFAARHQAAAFVSVHLNTDGSGSDAEGVETYFADTSSLSSRQLGGASGNKNGDSADFATAVQRMVCKATKAADRGTKRRSYTVVTQAACPAVLVECGFITSASECAKLKRESYRDQVAAGIAGGVTLFLQARPARSPLVATAAR